MLPEENIDQIFRAALENAKEIPPPNAWQGISSQLNQVSGVAQTAVTKSWFAKLGLISKVAIVSTTIITSLIAYELLKEDDSKFSQQNVSPIKTESIEEGDANQLEKIVEPEQQQRISILPYLTGNSNRKNEQNKFQDTVNSITSSLNKDFVAIQSLTPIENLKNNPITILDKVDVQKAKSETSTVLANLVENNCRHKVNLNVVESDSNGRLITVKCNGNVKNSYLYFGDYEFMFFEGNSMAVNHFYKVNSRKDFYVKIVSIFSNGCKDSAMTKVEVTPSISINEIMIPTVFTPNGDGKNDEYYLTIPEPKKFEMMVFDKGKKMIFSTTNYTGSWNGNCFGKPCADGNYEVVIKTQYSGEKESLTTRWVNLNRNSNGN